MTATTENSAKNLKQIDGWDHDDFMDTVEFHAGTAGVFILGTANAKFGCDQQLESDSGVVVESWEFETQSEAEAFMAGVAATFIN